MLVPAMPEKMDALSKQLGLSHPPTLPDAQGIFLGSQEVFVRDVLFPRVELGG
jgi:hypothetical protein